MLEEYGISNDAYKLVNACEKELGEVFERIDCICEKNSLKVLNAFKKYKLSEIHLSTSTGYGYDDLGRDTCEKIFAEVLGFEDALVRNQFISGSHALCVTLFALLRPGDTMLSISGLPYDTLHEVIGIKENGSSLKAFGVSYEQVDLINDNFDYEKIKETLKNKKIKLIEIQRSKGYSTRKSLTIDKVEKVIEFIRSIDKEVIIMIDNCYCEFVERATPLEVGADVIVTVGGGSAMDTAKGISIIMTNPDREDVVSLNGLSNTQNKGLPVIALPTTHGTAAEVTINYVITDEERQIKMVCVDPNDIPVLSIVDSELMETLPKGTAAATGLDALTHAVEGYITKAHNLIADMFHMKAIELIFENLTKAVNEKDPVAIENMSRAQYIAGMGFSNVGLGIVHSMAHQLGAVYDTPHGVANAILLPTVMRFNGEVCADRFREILCHIGRPDARDLNDQDVINTFVWMIEELSKSVGVTQRVSDVGCKEEDIEMLADKAMEDPCKPGNPREVTKEDFIRLYREAM